MGNIRIYPTQAGSYNTAFSLTENPISEGSRWINGAVDGRDWCNVRTSSGLAYGTQSGLGGYNDTIALLKGTWQANQGVQATVSIPVQSFPDNSEVELHLRGVITMGSIHTYECYWSCGEQSSPYVHIARWDGAIGFYTELASVNAVGAGVVNGDVIRAIINNQTITLYKNSNQVLTITDNSASKLVSGNPGIGFFQSSAGKNANFGFSSFSAWEIN